MDQYDPFKSIRGMMEEMNRIRDLSRINNPVLDAIRTNKALLDAAAAYQVPNMASLTSMLDDSTTQNRGWRRLFSEIEASSASLTAIESLGNSIQSNPAGLRQEIADLELLRQRGAVGTTLRFLMEVQEESKLRTPWAETYESLKNQVTKINSISGMQSFLDLSQNFQSSVKHSHFQDPIWKLNIAQEISKFATVLSLPTLQVAGDQWVSYLEKTEASQISIPGLDRAISVITAAIAADSAEDSQEFSESLLSYLQSFLASIKDTAIPPFVRKHIFDILLFLLSILHTEYKDFQASQGLASLHGAQARNEQKLDQILQLLQPADTSETPPPTTVGCTSEETHLYTEATLKGTRVLLLPKEYPLEVLQITEGSIQVRVVDFVDGEMKTGWISEDHFVDLR